MGLKTIPFRQLEKQTGDIFEAVTIISRRARQIIGDRYIIQEELRREEENLDEIGGETEMPTLELEPEQKEEYDRVAKPTTQAISELLSSELEWNYQTGEENSGEEEEA